MAITTWKVSRGQWTVQVGQYYCTICKPNDYDPLKMYWWEINGPARSRRGAASDLNGSKKMVQDALAECMKKDAAPGHTDLMVTPESMKEWVRNNQLPDEKPLKD